MEQITRGYSFLLLVMAYFFGVSGNLHKFVSINLAPYDPNLIPIVSYIVLCDPIQASYDTTRKGVINNSNSNNKKKRNNNNSNSNSNNNNTNNNINNISRRKFRSQTSDNMDRWKAEAEQKNREEKSRREKIREERESEERRCRWKSRNTALFQWFVAPEGRKVGWLKRRVRSHLARWEMKNCTPLWREAHLEVKMLKTPHVRTTFGSWDVETVHAVVARSTCRSQNVQNTPGSDHFWKLRCRKSARRCGTKHTSKSKCTKHTRFGPLLEVEMSKKCTPLWSEADSEVKMLKTLHVRASFGRSDVVSRGRRKGLWTLSKVRKMWGLCRFSKQDGRRGTFEEDLKSCSFRGGRRTRDMFIRAVRRSRALISWDGLHFGASDLQVCWDDFAWQVQHFRMTWHHFFVAGAVVSIDGLEKSQNTFGTRPSALHSTFHFWRTSRRIASFLMLSISKKQEVSQNCFVFDSVKCKNWGSLAELLRFWCCQVWKLRKPRKIASFSSLQIDR